MEIPDIKIRLNIITVLSHYNLKPDKNDFIRCPFHDDHTPSLKVYTKTNTFHCFGCGATGDQIQFIELFENLSKHQAIEKAKTLADPLHNINTKPMEQTNEKDLLPRLAVMGKIAGDSRAGFKRVDKARQYIESRAIDPAALDVGYIGPDFGKGWNSQLQESGLQLGILRKSRQGTLVPKFKNCLLFFTRNEKGQVIDLYGRSIINNNAAKHFYLNGHHQGIYPGYPHPGTKKLILVESFIDCATLQQQQEITGQFEVISLFGTNGFTEEIKKAIQELAELNEVILFFDGDSAGGKATLNLSDSLRNLRPEIKITAVNTPKDEDINSLVQGHDPEILLHLIRERKPVPDKNKTGVFDKESIPSGSTPDPVLDTGNPQKITYREGELQFTIWGGIEKDNIHRLKINLLTGLAGDPLRYYQDDVNLYSNSQQQRYIRGAAEELECSSTLLKTTLRRLQGRLEEYRLKVIEEDKKALRPKAYHMSREEQQQAMDFLQSKDLVQNTLEAIEKAGLVGEKKNGLLLFFLYLSRLFDEPLHAIIFGKSGSGKTYLQTKVSECLPGESLRTITSLTENTLYYSAKDFWKHKVLLIEDLEGVYNAFLPLREFMSKQSITKLTTDKDARGNNVQKVLVVEGPICVSGATTQGNIYEDNANRSFLLHIDESPAHMNEVMKYQRRLQAGLVNEKEQDHYRQLLKNAQRLLQRVKVINPYALHLDIPGCVFKKLRTNMHYLRLIEIITFYHQHQRQWKKDKDGRPFIESTTKDIRWANFLVKDTLLRKSDELGGDLRDFFEHLKIHLQSQNGNNEQDSFYAKDIRKDFRMHPQKLSRYLSNLERRGMIKLVSSNRQGGYEYQVISWNDYQLLKNNVDILDRILEKLQTKNHS